MDTYQNVETWVESVEENTNNPSNPTLTYRLALQFFYPEGTPLATAVPEPATYGVIAGSVLVMLALGHRRRKAFAP